GVDSIQARRAVRRAQRRRPRVPRLSLGELRVGEGVLPAEPVPVVDMEGQRDDLVSAKPQCRELANEGVRRGARAAPLRGEELDQHDPPPGGGSALRRGGAPGAGNGGEQERKPTGSHAARGQYVRGRFSAQGRVTGWARRRMVSAPASSGWVPMATTKRHHLVVRITHWVNALALTIMVGSGLRIFNAYPAFARKGES